MEGSAAGDEFVELVVRNMGATAAFDTRVSFDPELTSQARAQGGDPEDRVLLPSSFPVLVPGQEWRTFWDTTVARHGLEIPTRTSAHVVFEERSGRRVVEHALDYVLDWEVEQNRGPIRIFGMHHQAKAMRDLLAEVKRWRDTPKGVTVWTRDGEARQQRMRERLAPPTRWRKLVSRAKIPRGPWSPSA